MTEKADMLRAQILELVSEYTKEAFPENIFVPGQSFIPVSGKVFDSDDVQSLVASSLDFWLTTGRFTYQFEREFAKVFKIRYALLVNSGSSANLLALTCLTSPLLGTRQLKAGDEVITVAAGFPTTVNPIIQNNLIPVFVDVEIPSYNIDVSALESALTEKTKAIMIAHTLGNPFNVDKVLEFCRIHNLWLIEDCCDAVGALYKGQPVGRFGDISTVSFYPAHHITMGEGGAVLTDNPKLKKIIESYRDWGRDCWCDPGKDNTCGKRFNWQLGELPEGFDHKYTYSHIGYNLKATDMQAAVGVSQLKKLPQFIEARRNNYQYLFNGLTNLKDFFILPTATENSEPSWFGFPIALKQPANFTRQQLIAYLESKNIATRLLFAGNLTRQPAYKEAEYRIIGNLSNTDYILNNVFWIGIYPGINNAILDYVIETIHSFVLDFGINS